MWGGAERDRANYVIGGDALRGLGMVSVMLFHAAAGTAANLGPDAATDPVNAFGPFGQLFFRLDPAIWCFFALSGYLVGGPFVRAWVEGRRFPHFGRFASRRLRRIVPAFWVTIGALYLIYGGFGASKQELLLAGTFLQTWDHSQFEIVFVQAWTVGVEMAFYFSLPLLAFLVSRLRLVRGTRRTRLTALLVFLGVLAAASFVVRVIVPPDGSVGRSIFSTFWAIAPGLALAGLEPDLRARLAGKQAGKLVAACASAVLAGSFLVYYLTMAEFGTFVGEVTGLLMAASALTALLTWQWAWGSIPKLLDNRVIHALGRWSYAFYLVHVAIVRELCLNLPDGMSNGVALLYVSSISFGASMTIAALSWWLLEEPFIEKRPPRAPWRTWRRSTEPPHTPVEEPRPAPAAAG